MNRQHMSGKKIGIGSIAIIVILFCSLPLPVFSQPLSGFDIDDSDPVGLTSRIMEFHPAEGRMVVAEQQVWIVDFMLGNGQPFKTALENSRGRPIPLDAFARRQLVRVQGFKLPDGRIIAARIQQVSRRENQNQRRSRARVRRMEAARPVE